MTFVFQEGGILVVTGKSGSDFLDTDKVLKSVERELSVAHRVAS